MKNFNPKVSILIPVYNGSNYLKDAIDSALAQTYKNIEIIVVNDGSNDNGATEKIAKSYGNKIRYFKKENGGVATALNFGIKKMTGEYFSWLSHDDMYYPEKIEKQIDVFFKTKSDCSIVFSNVEYIDEKSKTIYQTSYESKYTKKQLSNGMFIVINALANGCSLLLPKTCFDQCGLFNEDLRTSNDYDMWFRLFRKCSILFTPQVLIKYRLHKMQGTRTEKVYIDESNKLWSSIIEDLTKKEILEFNDSLFSFYYGMVIKMNDAKLKEAYDVSFKLAKKYYNQCPRMVSVIMPCYNSETYLKEAIDSIITQTFGNFELIIVNDGSTDQTTKIVKELMKKDYRIRLLNNIYKKGIAGAMNTGIKFSEGKYITRMDSDDISLPSRLEKQVGFLEENAKYGLCSTNISLFGEQNVSVLFNKKDAPLEWLFLWEDPIANAPTMYRGSIIKDNKIKFGDYKSAEDYDFLTRIIFYARPYTLDEVLYSYRVRSDSVFHSDTETAIVNSIAISDALASKVSHQKVPYFHRYLTVFLDKELNGEIDILGMSSWLDKLLANCQKEWGWTEEEYKHASTDANKRLMGLLFLSLRANIDTDLGILNDRSARTNRRVIMTSVLYRVARKLYREGPGGVVKAAMYRLRRK